MMALDVFSYSDYRVYLREVLEMGPRRGYGQKSNLAKHLRVSNVFVSQVLSGKRELSLEQAMDVADYLDLSLKSRRYYLRLLLKARAGTQALKKEIESELAELSAEHKKIASHVPAKHQIGETEKALFYSDWTYSALRLASSIPGLNDPNSLAKHFGLEKSEVEEKLNFLLRTGLCKKNGPKIVMGPASTHLSKPSPWIKNRHLQWRLRAVEQSTGQNNLSYTAPVAVSMKDAGKFKLKLLTLISDFAGQAEQSPSEEVWCLNLDWFST